MSRAETEGEVRRRAGREDSEIQAGRRDGGRDTEAPRLRGPRESQRPAQTEGHREPLTKSRDVTELAEVQPSSEGRAGKDRVGDEEWLAEKERGEGVEGSLLSPASCGLSSCSVPGSHGAPAARGHRRAG